MTYYKSRTAFDERLRKVTFQRLELSKTPSNSAKSWRFVKFRFSFDAAIKSLLPLMQN